MRECVVFKGSRHGLQLVIDSSVDFELILDHLRSKLESAIDFFTAGVKIKVPATAAAALTERQVQELSSLLEGFGLQFEAESDLAIAQAVAPTAQDEWEQADCGAELVVSRTIRGGQEIIYSGSVVVNGDINPGGEVIAGGNVTVNGTCRGIVHAGAYGDRSATITARRLLASQIRIAGLIVRSPDEQTPPEQAEIAYIEDGNVIIAPAAAGPKQEQ